MPLVPGFTPKGILAAAAQSGRYSEAEIRALDFTAPAPTAADLSRRWHAALETAQLIVDVLPAEYVGCCVLDDAGRLFRGDPARLQDALASDPLRFHAGSIRGALPVWCRHRKLTVPFRRVGGTPDR